MASKVSKNIMKYQRVLYTDKFTIELKSKLRIVFYKKCRSLKGNVYYVTFASNADVEYADRISKHLRNVTLKPFKAHCAVEAQHDNRMNIGSHQQSLAPSSVPPSSSTIPVLSPSTLQTSNLVNSSPDAILIESNLPSSEKDKEQLINNVESCLSAMEAARQAADNLCQLYEHGIDYLEALNHLFKVHSTAFYLKVAISAQIKAAFLAGLRLPWSAVVNSINVLNTDVRHEQSFMAQVTSFKYISSKIDSTTSIAMSSKLAYQLTKLSD